MITGWKLDRLIVSCMYCSMNTIDSHIHNNRWECVTIKDNCITANATWTFSTTFAQSITGLCRWAPSQPQVATPPPQINPQKTWSRTENDSLTHGWTSDVIRMWAGIDGRVDSRAVGWHWLEARTSRLLWRDLFDVSVESRPLLPSLFTFL